jgi:prepilin-type N-terminal cleavage/methylation domain-containing protein
MKNRQAGYSLAEMLTVVAIVGTLALVTVPAFVNFYQSNKMKASMRSFTTDLRSARQRAITRGRQVIVVVELTASGAAQANYKRKYYSFDGNLNFNSTAWTPVAISSTTSTANIRTLDDVVYFPTHNATSSPQTFEDTLDCTLSTCSAGTDGKVEIMFFPDGRVRIPSGATVGKVSIKTDMKIPKNSYTVEISPSGAIKAVAN